jgi:23S rRNA pseudouridine1911/1915/1917 synthase
VVEDLRDASLLEVRLRTGRRNQIRVQAAIRGHALVGERRYLSAVPSPAPIHFERQALHALRLTFSHPRDGRTMTLEAPPPPDFCDLLNRLRPPRRRRPDPGSGP